MKSNAYICVFVVGVLLVTSAFATDTSQDEKKSNHVKDANKEEEALETNPYYGGRRCRYGCCGRLGHFGCTHCCRPAELGDAEANEVTAEDAEGGGYGYGYGGNGGGYRYGWSGDMEAAAIAAILLNKQKPMRRRMKPSLEHSYHILVVYRKYVARTSHHPCG
nr:late embryogenesis abundant protein M17-like isoform X1 [Ipomoea batatas]